MIVREAEPRDVGPPGRKQPVAQAGAAMGGHDACFEQRYGRRRLAAARRAPAA